MAWFQVCYISHAQWSIVSLWKKEYSIQKSTQKRQCLFKHQSWHSITSACISLATAHIWPVLRSLRTSVNCIPRIEGGLDICVHNPIYPKDWWREESSRQKLQWNTVTVTCPGHLFSKNRCRHISASLRYPLVYCKPMSTTSVDPKRHWSSFKSHLESHSSRNRGPSPTVLLLICRPWRPQDFQRIPLWYNKKYTFACSSGPWKTTPKTLEISRVIRVVQWLGPLCSFKTGGYFPYIPKHNPKVRTFDSNLWLLPLQGGEIEFNHQCLKI